MESPTAPAALAQALGAAVRGGMVLALPQTIGGVERAVANVTGFWRRYGVIILALAAIAAVSLGALYLRGGPLEVGIFRAFNSGLASPILDILSRMGYVLGSFWFSLALFAALFFFVGCRRFALSALGAIVAGAALVLLIKYLSLEPRPWQVLSGVRFTGVREGAPAFPSGHAEQAFLSVYLLASYFSLRWYAEAGLYLLATFVGCTRIYSGDHLPLDVLAGALIGLLVGVLWVHSRLWPGRRAP